MKIRTGGHTGARGLILEGVTGTGKTHVLDLIEARARAAGAASWRIFREEETYGELLDELRRPDLTDEARCARLHAVLGEVRAHLAAARGDAAFVLERFHPSYFAQMPSFGLYAALDAALAELGCRIVLLDLPEAELERRSLRRVDREGTDWLAGMTGYYGSEAGALAAILASQRRRREILTLSALPSLVIDTTAMDWARHADEAMAFFMEEVIRHEDRSACRCPG
ncbi:MAG: hypothetical protein IT372_16700 [Polyangiaceae bacterium]|nr:hypothetical protein [Polyangiaceae bacterium]